MEEKNKKIFIVIIITISILFIAFFITAILMMINDIKNRDKNKLDFSDNNESNQIIEVDNNAINNPIIAIIEEKEKIYGYDENAMQVASEYNGYPACGFIEIEKIGLSMPILGVQTPDSMEYSCSMVYSNGEINLRGLSYITGHNYDNGTLFSNIKKLSVGDKIVITGLYKNRIEYTIYNTFNTSPEDSSYLTKKVDDNNIEIALQCCNNDAEDTRFIIQAVHEINK